MTKSKLKFIKDFIFFVVAMISIDFIVSKVFKTVICQIVLIKKFRLTINIIKRIFLRIKILKRFSFLYN